RQRHLTAGSQSIQAKARTGWRAAGTEARSTPRWLDLKPPDNSTGSRAVPVFACLRSPFVDRARRYRHMGFEVAGKAAGGPGDAHGRDGLVEQGDAREFDQLEIERLGHAREVIIPLEDLAELKAGVELPAALAETVEMAAHQVQPLFEPRVGPGLACSCPPVELSEEERIGQRSAADRDRRAACLLEHRGRVGNGTDVAVGHDGNSFHGPDHGTYAMPVH